LKEGIKKKNKNLKNQPKKPKNDKQKYLSLQLKDKMRKKFSLYKGKKNKLCSEKYSKPGQILTTCNP
jgi:hypothetical protein